ncbi:hypothetical protein KTF36_07740 [Burkholderia gladioli]|uniref:hypothetical protein n=1 Tax=Burkholderia gladioli TaxID=28095 RepID=UPI001C2204E5|nr:hypothetical protein [Burkholderia gladioli]MBU9641736.1 hypothetical protein [Burkholderia gladioli]
MLALKLTLVPLFLLVVSMSGTWWGPSIAGWLAGLPVVAGPILFLLVLEHGPAFGAQAALLSLAAILASEAFNFTYAWTCRARAWPIALGAGLLVWAMAAAALARLPGTPLAAALAALAAIAFGQAFLPRGAAGAANLPLARRDLAGRMLAGALLTLAVTALSNRAGPAWSGLLAVFPLLGSVLAVSSHRAHGAGFAIALLRGMVLGRFSFVAFCLALAYALPHWPIPLAFGTACATAMLVQWATRRLARAASERGNHAAGLNLAAEAAPPR